MTLRQVIEMRVFRLNCTPRQVSTTSAAIPVGDWGGVHRTHDSVNQHAAQEEELTVGPLVARLAREDQRSPSLEEDVDPLPRSNVPVPREGGVSRLSCAKEGAEREGLTHSNFMMQLDPSARLATTPSKQCVLSTCGWMPWPGL